MLFMNPQPDSANTARAPNKKKNSLDYKVQRKKRGTQMEVAAQLGVRQATISDRETGGEISLEAWLALCALPLKLKGRK